MCLSFPLGVKQAEDEPIAHRKRCPHEDFDQGICAGYCVGGLQGGHISNQESLVKMHKCIVQTQKNEIKLGIVTLEMAITPTEHHRARLVHAGDHNDDDDAAHQGILNVVDMSTKFEVHHEQYNEGT